jgi:spermidine synthase
MQTSPATMSDDDHVKPFVHQQGGQRLLQFSLNVVQSSMDLAQPDALTLGYTRLMMGFVLFVPRPARIGMIGLGGGSLAKFCHRHLPQASIQVAEINPHVLALRDEFQVPPDSERFQVLLCDGAAFVRQPAQSLDVLLVDGFDYDGLPEALSNQGFYDDCSEALGSAGLLVANLPSGQPALGQQVERIGRSFGGAALVVDDADQGNCIVFASQQAAPTRMHAGPLRKPRGMDATAWAALQPAFARIQAAAQAEVAAPGRDTPR